MRTESVHIGGRAARLKSTATSRGIAGRWHAIRRRHKWWQLTLFIIGVITAISVLSALFFAVGDKPDRIYTDATAAAC